LRLYGQLQFTASVIWGLILPALVSALICCPITLYS
jgi:hypothetical protein